MSSLPCLVSVVVLFPSFLGKSFDCLTLSFVNDFIKDYGSEKENILVVTHGAITRIYADNAQKKDGYKIKDAFLRNCHLVIYEYENGQALLVGYNISSDRLDEFLEGKWKNFFAL